ncbi:hypothetical protein AVEN_267432-1 [Araneus ventricosus]|uniref:Uncharacterized protein n=1 Tax=Araneus ventricosus TaxID=182803 RepID=A0A4Y2SMX1_ARAVE|nr:hypothetical protein AVEN_267432-1 [Araneus ventricosus]
MTISPWGHREFTVERPRISKRVLASLVGIVMVWVELPPLRRRDVSPSGGVGEWPVMTTRAPALVPTAVVAPVIQKPWYANWHDRVNSVRANAMLLYPTLLRGDLKYGYESLPY